MSELEFNDVKTAPEMKGNGKKKAQSSGGAYKKVAGQKGFNEFPKNKKNPGKMPKQKVGKVKAKNAK